MKKTRIKTLFATLLVCMIMLGVGCGYSRYLSVGHNPEGGLDSITGSVGGTILQGGWWCDSENLNEMPEIHCYIGNPADSSSASDYAMTADAHCSDADNTFSGIWTCRGFYQTVNTNKTGIQTIYACAISVGEAMSCWGHRR